LNLRLGVQVPHPPPTYLGYVMKQSRLFEAEPDECFQLAVQKKYVDLGRERKAVKQMADIIPVWTTPVPIATAKIKGGLGVYMMIYEPTMEIVSIGQGKVGARKTRHMTVLKNGGKDIMGENSNTHSQTAKKMHKFDSNINKWLFSYTILNQKSLCSEYEAQLQKKFKPRFSNLSMAGVH
jgi:hypothetical protein